MNLEAPVLALLVYGAVLGSYASLYSARRAGEESTLTSGPSMVLAVVAVVLATLGVIAVISLSLEGRM